MVTIEQCEVEIEAKAEIIRSQLARFEENIGQIGSVIGKDSTEVYQTLTNKFNETIDVYNTSTRRNVEILTGYITTLNNIQIVLADVMLAIDKLESDNREDLTERLHVDEIMERVAQATDTVVQEAEKVVEEVTGTEIKAGTLKPVMLGGGAFLLGRVLGLSNTLSIAGAAAAAYYGVKK